jgi:hypothetical protein
MSKIDINSPTASIPQGTDINGVRMGRIYGDTAEMMRLHNAYRPTNGDKYDLDRIRRKRGEYEYRQLQSALYNQRSIYAKELGISILELENKISETPEIMETLFQRAFDSLPRTCKTIIGSLPIKKINQDKPENKELINE